MPRKRLGYRVFESVYELIFHENLNSEALKFFTATSYVAIGTLFGSLLTLVFYIFGARVLGPTNFGNLTLVITVSTILAISMQINLQAAIKYGSGARDDSTRSCIISTFGLQVALLTTGSTAIFILFSGQLSTIFGIPLNVYLYAVSYAAIITFFVFTTNLLRILFKIRAFALLNALQSVIVLAAFFVFVSANIRSWQAAVFSIDIANAAIGMILVVYLRQYLKLQFDRFWSRKLLNYAAIALPGVIAGSFVGIDRILINRFITTAAVGIYSAYYLPSITLSVALWGIVNASYFPSASKSEDRVSIFHNVNKAVPYIAATLVPLFFFVEYIIFIFYGHQYPFSVELGLLFAFAATASFVCSCYYYLMASEGIRGAKVNTFSSIIAVLIGVDVALIPLIGILGAAIGFISAELTATLYLLSRRRILSASRSSMLK
jgi:O-antigen/teichoic acid export membrane protein